MKSSTKAMLMILLTTSTIMIISSSSWMMMWIGLEINLMSFIPLISSAKNTSLSQGAMSYFLTQAMASMVFLMSIMMEMFIIKSMTTMMLTKYIIMMTMMMKMGMPPFHLWFPTIMHKINWMESLIMMTWQKIAPMYIISMFVDINKITTTIICISTLMGGIGGLNQTSMKKILAYSSMNHMGWMMACTITHKKSWMMYMIIYSFMMITIILLLKYMNMIHINQMNMFSMTVMDKITLTTMMMSLGGLPPFLGFFPKWLSIQSMMSSKEFIMMMIMIMSSLMTLVYYMRMVNWFMLMMTHSQKWMINNKNKMYMMSMLLYTNMGLPIMYLTWNFL